MKQHIFNVILFMVFGGIAIFDIFSGRHWESLIWFFAAFWNIAIILMLQNQDKIDKLEEIRQLLKEGKK